ncbi:MAG TPA: glycosyltransferase [Schlesneria sp.]
MEPPVDTERDRPAFDKHAADEFRARYAPDPTLPLAVMVCRLVPELKRESLLNACGAIEELALSGAPTQLVLVGDGSIKDELAARAEQTNMRAGRKLVVLTGELSDPRPAYDAADVVLGMGSSALRALAFAKPLVVVGERGFSELLTPQTAPIFLANGWYGLGPGSLGEGVTGMRRSLSTILGNATLRAELGKFGRDLVLDRFSLFAAAKKQEEEYEHAIANRVSRSQLAAAATKSLAGIIDYKVRRKISRWRGTIAVDDANAVAAFPAQPSPEPGQLRI